MLECNRFIRKRLRAFAWFVALAVPVMCAALLLSQIASAKTTYVISDGDRTVIHTTLTTDPLEVLLEAGLELGEDDTYITQDEDGVNSITVHRSMQITVICGNKTTELTVYGGTVASVLDDLGLSPGPLDAVSQDLYAPVTDGMEILIIRGYTQEESYLRPIEFDTLYILDLTLPADGQTVLVAGVEGQQEFTDRVLYHSGAEVLRENLSIRTIREPVSQVIAVGSLDGIESHQLYRYGTHNALDYCTGDGKLHISPELIITADGEVLPYASTLQVVATAYHNTDPGCTIYTAIGTLCRVGAIAVDPKVIPYGTEMFIVTNDGRYIYGKAVAEDCGSAIKGNRVDLYFDTTDECWEFGIRDATVFFLG